MNQSSNKSEFFNSLAITNEIIGGHGIRLVSIFGVLYNIHNSFVLRDKRLKIKFYYFLRCRCFCSLVVCILGCFLNPKITDPLVCQEIKEWWSFYLQLFVVGIPFRIALMSSFISDILLILNRVALLFDKKLSKFYLLSKKVSNENLCD